MVSRVNPGGAVQWWPPRRRGHPPRSALPREEPLRGELQAFLLAVRTGREPVVTGEHGVQAIDIATRILDQIKTAQDSYYRRRQGRAIEVGGDL